MNQVRLFFELPQVAVAKTSALVEDIFEEDGIPVSSFEIDEDKGVWALSLYLDADQSDDARDRLLACLKTISVEPELQTEILEETNWVEKTLQELAPVRAGRFVVHGSHDAGCAAPNEHSVLIDAGMAFGTGHHGTTAGCLAMIDRELKRKTPWNALDLGSGTGVLAIAIAKAARIPVLASDIDPVADQIARQNAKLNGVSAFVESITSTGFNNRRFMDWTPFDLVVANILAGPLQAMAHELSTHLASKATVILSGLLPHQKPRIVATYRANGLALDHAHYQNGWMTLVFRNMA
ncbi:MAG: 50S ribosomal protein L11 methyltransferase [Salaquimonas sp.]